MKKATVTAIEKIWLSNKEAQAYLGVGMEFFKSLRSSGQLPYSKVGKTVFYRNTRHRPAHRSKPSILETQIILI